MVVENGLEAAIELAAPAGNLADGGRQVVAARPPAPP
jgi:hypothetical protein